jgi:membrane-associated phospholipid phosphatase
MQAARSWIIRHFGTLSMLFAGVLLPLWLFGSVAGEVVEKEPFSFDHPIMMFVHSHETPLLDSLMYFFTKAGSALTLVPLFVVVFVMLMRRGQRASATFWAVSVAGAALINFLAKQGFGRVRPDLWVSRVHETTYSFPSGHAMSTMAVVAALTFLLWKTRWRWIAAALGAVFVLMVSLSRVYWGVHYPSDILAGWAASLAWVAGVRMMFDRRRAGDSKEAVGLKTSPGK